MTEAQHDVFTNAIDPSTDVLLVIGLATKLPMDALVDDGLYLTLYYKGRLHHNNSQRKSKQANKQGAQ